MQPCNQSDRITTLENNDTKIMEILTEVRDDVKDIKKFIFEWPMDDKYVSKEKFDTTVEFMKQQFVQREKEIQELRKNQNKVAWIIISTVLVAILGIVLIPKAL